jgi:hypothetical protein
MIWFFVFIILYLPTGYIISLLIERHRKKTVFGLYDRHMMPRFAFALMWPAVIPVYLAAVIIVKVFSADIHEKIAKFIRGF